MCQPAIYAIMLIMKSCHTIVEPFNAKSFAGKLGSASRWKDHVKVETTLIRVNTYDRDFLVCLASDNSLSVASVVSRLCRALRDCKISLPES